MEYRIPNYFQKFSCIGGSCPDTCCAGWQIVIDMESLEKYQNLEGSFGNRLRNEIDWEEGVFQQYKGECCFLNEDKLCDIYKEVGQDKLCKTCRVYPRHIEEYAGLQEVFLCMSCPEVSRIIFEDTDKVTLVDEQTEEEDQMDDFEDFDFLLFTKLEDTREYLIEVLQNREEKIYERCSYLLYFGEQLQKLLENDEIFRMDQLLEDEKIKVQKLPIKEQKQENDVVPEARSGVMKNVLELLLSLEIRKDSWKKQLETAKELLYTMDSCEYQKKMEEFRNVHCFTQEDKKKWKINFEKVVVYYMLTYYCGAVYDDEILSKIKFSILNALAIEELLFAKWLKSGIKIELEDWIQVSYEYARELEHSDTNMEQFELAIIEQDEFFVEKIVECLAYCKL